jgi:pimeloyl-ACP methyl ester carboxylesterase
MSAALTVFALLVGATYQGVATAIERREFPRPGGLIDIGGRQLHLTCVGEGAPTVVLEAAAGSMSAAWAWVQHEVGNTTRVCSYDRSGLGWSEAGDGGFSPLGAPDDLRTLLQRGGERAPFVLVGDELGASLARLFAARHAEAVAALVLVDDPMTSDETGSQDGMVRAWPWLARAGILRATGRLARRALLLPPEGAALRAFLNRPDHLTRAAEEISRIAEVRSAAAVARIDPAIAVTLVSVGVRPRPAILARSEEAAPVIAAIRALLEVFRPDVTTAEAGHSP